MLGTRFGGRIAAVATAASLFIVTVGPVAARSGATVDPNFTNPAQQADWRQSRGAADHRGWNQSESTLSISTVPGLKILWRASGGFNSSPAVANGIVYNGDAGLAAYPADCATDGSYCAPIWNGGTGYPDWNSPAVAGGMVYMQSVNGLFAFNVDCRSDGGRCPPVWTAPSANSGYTSPTIANGLLFVAVAAGRLQAYDVQSCASAGGVCAPMWSADLFGSEPMSSPTVSKGVVYIVGNDGFLYAFDTRCATGGGTCSPIWQANIHDRSQGTPAVANGVVYVATNDGNLYAFKVGCAKNGAACDPIWFAKTGSYVHGSPAVTDDTVYVANTTRLYAFGVGCGTNGALCQPLWRSGWSTDTGGFASSPAVANDFVYIGTQGAYQRNGRLLAYAAHCSAANGVCKAIWRSPFLGAMVNSSPAVAHGMVYVASNSGRFYAFGLPPTP